MVKIIYRVQAGAFSSKPNADKLLASLTAAGIEAVIATDGGDGLFRVNIGSYENPANADARIAEAAKKNFKCIKTEFKLTIPDPINYRELCAKKAGVVYSEIVKLGCRHKGGATTFDEIKSKKITTCSASVSAVLQEAGILPKGKLVSHTAAIGGTNENQIKKKNTLAAAVKGHGALDMTKCKIVKCMKCWNDLSAECKQPGVVYVQDSNICISGGTIDGKHFNYSCNEGGSQVDKNGHYILNKMTSGYTFTRPVLYAIVPLTV